MFVHSRGCVSEHWEIRFEVGWGIWNWAIVKIELSHGIV